MVMGKMIKKISFIGVGAMGSAVLERLIDVSFISKDSVLACDIDQNRLDEIKRKFNVGTSIDNRDAARFGDAVILAVPPKQTRQVLEEIKDSLSEDKVLVSLAALVSIRVIEETLKLHVGVTRVMPNIPSLVGEGFNVFSFGRYMSSEGKKWVRSFLKTLGEYREVEEEKMENYTILSAMGPTYFLPFVDTLIKFGVDQGLSYEEARTAVSSTLRGTAELVSKVDKPVEDLKNMIGTQPLKAREQELRSMMETELNRICRQLKTAREMIG